MHLQSESIFIEPKSRWMWITFHWACCWSYGLKYVIHQNKKLIICKPFHDQNKHHVTYDNFIWWSTQVVNGSIPWHVELMAKPLHNTVRHGATLHSGHNGTSLVQQIEETYLFYAFCVVEMSHLQYIIASTYSLFKVFFFYFSLIIVHRLWIRDVIIPSFTVCTSFSYFSAVTAYREFDY